MTGPGRLPGEEPIHVEAVPPGPPLPDPLHDRRVPLRPGSGSELLPDPLRVAEHGAGRPTAAGMSALLAAAPGVIGVGIDVVAVGRFAAAMRRTPALAYRLFTGPERVTVSGSARSAASLAARFAVKEAVAKALGVPAGMDWHDCTVVSEASGRPALLVTGTVAAACDSLGIRNWRISLSHDAGIAAAIVVALG